MSFVASITGLVSWLRRAEGSHRLTHAARLDYTWLSAVSIFAGVPTASGDTTLIPGGPICAKELQLVAVDARRRHSSALNSLDRNP